MEALRNWISENKGLFAGLCMGLAAAILILTIGFWATLLIAVLTGAGAFVGAHPHVCKNVSDWFASLFKNEKKL